MNQQRSARVRQIFDEALSYAGDAQAEYVRTACRGDQALLNEVNSLLAEDTTTGRLRVRPLFDDERAEEIALPDVPGYRVTRRLGAGGMGVVYEAVQLETKRRVALKTVHAQNTDDELRMRLFKREIETLARLDHANIATIYEAVRTDDQKLYFAMELVEGQPLDHYIARTLGSQKRDSSALNAVLHLFVQLCSAVHYAHQRGVIHRDLKPSNIFIVSHGETPAGVKVLDFGLARLVDDEIRQTQLTEVGSIRGTLRYMSPEQADSDSSGVDVRSDVYSLGVILYQILTRQAPHDLEGLSLIGALKKICTETPEPPSAHNSDLDEDLEIITLKALALQPEDRYQGANALGDDLTRFLSSLPIDARRPTAWYQLKKLVRRNTLSFALATGIFLLTAGAAVALSILYLQSERNLARATTAEAATQREAQTASRISEFLIQLFEVADPSQSRGETVTARELLDAGVARIDRDLEDEPLVQAALKETMGSVYRSLGLYDSAEPLLESALQTFEDAADGETGQSLPVLRALAGLRFDQGRYEESQRLAERALAETKRQLGPEHEDVGHTMAMVSAALTLQGKFDESEPIARQALELNLKSFGENHERTADSLRKLGALYTAMQRYDDAAQTIDRELAIRQQFNDELAIAGALHERAEIHFRQGEYPEAEARYREVLAVLEPILGPDHPTLAFEYNNLGVLYRRMKRVEDAERAYRRALAIREKALPEDHPMIAWTLDNLGLLLVYENRLDEAEPLLERARSIAEIAVGTDHPDYGIVLNNLARLRERQGRLDEAEALQRGQIEIIRAKFEPNNLNLGIRLSILAEILYDRKKFSEAIEVHVEAMAIFAHHDDEEELRLGAELMEKLQAAAQQN